jgi:hypothetical protein
MDYVIIALLVMGITNAVLGSCIPILFWRLFKDEDRQRRFRKDFGRKIEALDKTLVQLLKMAGFKKDDEQ